MKKPISFIFLALTFTFLQNHSIAQENKVLSPRNASYNIDAKLDVKGKLIDATSQLTWRNITQDTITNLQFHLYLNAFKNTESTFMKESGGTFRGDEAGSEDLSWGYCDILEMKIENGENLTSKIKYIQPDDDNNKDQTVIEVKLSDSIMPGEIVKINFKFKSKLPKIFARTGFADNYFFVGQWFPKIGVYEPAGMRYAKKGGWNCHQFHAHSEFYSDYGVYHVNITVPKDYVVGATGQQVEENISGNEKTLKYLAEDVIDFAWTASQRYLDMVDQWQDVKIRLLIQPEHKDMADRYFESAKVALDYFSRHLGAYPYQILTIIDPPMKGINDPSINGSGSGGMEYPTLITGGTVAWLPKGIRTVENVTVHEFGHQYFMGIIATNEFEEAWLDEGMNSYFETLIMDATYGDKTSMFDIAGFRMGDTEMNRTGYAYNDNRSLAESFRYAWEYPIGTYGMMSYSKPATFMNTLHRLVGNECMDEIMKTYYKRWKFRHPSSTDFINIVNEVVEKKHGEKFGTDMNWFFEQVLYGSGICDYKLQRIVNNKLTKPDGLFDKNGNKVSIDEIGADSLKNYESKVLVTRLGDVVMPVEVLIRFEDGQEITKTWDGMTRSVEFKFLSNSKILYAQIDPQHKLLVDVNLSNNSIQLEQNTNPVWKYSVKFLFWLQNVLQSVVWFV
ncbi:MAG: M1 family metallopeptidase [Bacteroidales bacterium]